MVQQVSRLKAPPARWPSYLTRNRLRDGEKHDRQLPLLVTARLFVPCMSLLGHGHGPTRNAVVPNARHW